MFEQRLLSTTHYTIWLDCFYLSTMATQQTPNNNLKELDLLTRLMDSQFRVPGTNLRFGLDGILGLIPGIGDLSTMAVSGFMLIIMAKKGASGLLLARMTLNVLLDFVIGSIPFVGDLFDFGFKANTRNMKLMHQYYKEGRHQGSATRVIIPVLLVLLIFIAVIGYVFFRLIRWVYGMFV